MGDNGFAITAGSGTEVHGWARSVASTSRIDQFVIPGANPYATYTAQAVVRANTANSHLMFIQGDGTNYVHVRRVTLRAANIASAASTLDIRVFRTSTAGSGGTAVSARSFDENDGSYGGTIQTLPSSKGTEGNQLKAFRVGVPASNPLTRDNGDEWVQNERDKPIICGTATTNGIAIKNINSLATEVDVEVEFSLLNFL